MEPVQPENAVSQSLSQTSKKRAVVSPLISLPNRGGGQKIQRDSTADLPIPEWPTLPPVDMKRADLSFLQPQTPAPPVQGAEQEELSPSKLVRSLPMPRQANRVSGADFSGY